MTIAISHINTVGFSSELAELLLQNDANQSESAHLQRSAARASYLDAVQSQVNELNSAADATLSAAFVSAAFSIAGGACEIGGAISQFKADSNAAGLDPDDFCGEVVDMRELVAAEAKTAKIWNAVGTTASELAKPTTMIGESMAGHDQAAAKRWEAAGAEAQWEASDANTEIDKAGKRSDGTLDTLQGIQSDQNSANNAIIGRI